MPYKISDTLVLVFLFVLAVILVSDTLSTAMLVISLLANALVMSSILRSIGEDQPVSAQAEPDFTWLDETPMPLNHSVAGLQNYEDRGRVDPPSVQTKCPRSARVHQMVDDNIAQHSLRRAGNEPTRAMINKPLEYYKYYYDGEFEDNENKYWWSAYED
jgi:hypothetical protein